MDLNNSNNENKGSFTLESLDLDYGEEEKQLIEEETGDSKQRMKSLLKRLDIELNNVKKFANLDMTLKYVDTNQMPQFNNNFNDNQINNDQKIFVEVNNGIDNENDENDEDKVKFKNINYISDKNNNNINININNNNIDINNNNIDINNNNNDINNNNNNNNSIAVNQINSNYNTELINNNDNNNNSNDNDIELVNENENEKPTIVTSIRVNNFKELNNILNSENEYQKIQDSMKKESQLSKAQQKDDIDERKEQEMKEIEEMRKKQEEEFNKKMEELKRKEEEIKKREEELNNQIILEKERKEKEEVERKRRLKEEEEERRRREEEEQKRKEAEEEEQRDRLLIEEEERLRQQQKEMEEEEKRENDRIKKERLLKEQKEKEEEERKRKEEEEKKRKEEEEKKKKEKEEKELKEQMEKNNLDDEVEIKDMDEDDIEELEEEVSYTETSNFKSRIKQSITKSALPKNNLKSINQSLNNNNAKFKSQMLNKKNVNIDDITESQLENNEESKNNDNGNKNNNVNSKTASVAKSINLKNKSLKNSKVPKVPKSEVKKSNISEDSKVPKQQKEPEKEIKDKSLRDSQSLYDNQTKFENSDIFKKLTEEMRNKVLECIKNVEEFDISHPNLDDIADYPFIDKFEKDEKPLSEIISDYENKLINFYDEEYIDNKVQTISSGELFEDEKKVVDLLCEIANIPNETHIEVIKKNYQKEKLKNLPKTEDGELTDYDKLEEKLFSDDEFLPEFNCPFSKLEDLQTFIYKYSAHENPKLMGNSVNNFNNWRMTLSDGNSFYRVNMFAIIENCIFESNSELLSAILNEMTSDEFIKVYKKKNLEYEKPFNILSAILALITNDMQDKAYDLFLKAYNLKSGCFDLLLIVYLKRVLYVFAEEINKLLKEQKKTSNEKEIIDKTIINLDEIDNLFIDPNINMFYLMSFLFDINIYILSVHDKFLKSKDKLKKIINAEEEENPSPTFIFGYFYSSYHILYRPNFNHKIFEEKLKQDNPKITQLTSVTKDRTKCNMCKKETRHIIFLRKKFIVCELCLKNYLVNEIMNERKSFFFGEKCFAKEYYSRPIHLQSDFYLDDYEYIEIFEENNIFNEICKNYECLHCQKSSLNPESLVQLNCGCTYCQDCFEKIFKDITIGYGYLLDIEAKLNGNKNLICKCKKKYYYQDLEKFHEKDEDEIHAAEDRKKDYIKKYCMSCFKDLEQKESKVKKIKMRKDSNTLDHFMCTECYNLNFKSKPSDENEEEEEEENEDDTRDMAKESSSKSKIVNKENQIVHCRICSEDHKYIEETGNCACLIY